MSRPSLADKLADELAAAIMEIETLRAENLRLRGLLGLNDERAADPPAPWTPTLFVTAPSAPRPTVDRRSAPTEKVALFRTLFAGRDDVYAERWENQAKSTSGWSPKVVGGWANAKRPDREYVPLTDTVIEAHLSGDLTAGLYPLMRNDRCRLLVCDFDGGTWTLDALAYLDTCRAAGLPAVLERSRSGDGGHVWVFFDAPVAASDARKVGAAMLRRAMASRVEIDLSVLRNEPRWECPNRHIHLSDASPSGIAEREAATASIGDAQRSLDTPDPEHPTAHSHRRRDRRPPNRTRHNHHRGTSGIEAPAGSRQPSKHSLRVNSGPTTQATY